MSVAKFVYRMQNILDIKSKLEVQAKNDFAQANAALLEEQEKLTEYFFKKRSCEERLRDEYSKEKLDLSEVQFWKSNIEYTEGRIKEQTVCVMNAQTRADAKKEQMLQLMKERKTQEILKEGAFQQFVQEVRAEESKEVDELVSYTYGKKQNESR